MKYLYYPGCSLKGAALDYEESFLAIAPLLGIEIKEIGDWNCCGATAAKSVNLELAETLPRQALVRAAGEGMDLLILCPSCHLNHLGLAKKAEKDPCLKEKLLLPRIPRVKMLLEVLAFDVGMEQIKQKVVKPLEGLKVLPYYGCLVVRPFSLGGKESLEFPTTMENIITALGGQPISFPYKLDCCGGGLLLSKEKVSLKLSATIMREVKKQSPDCLMVACPLCHFMLDARQRIIERELREKIRIPVFYVSQLIGIAIGVDPKSLGFHRLLVSPGELLQKINHRNESHGEKVGPWETRKI